MRFLKKLLKHTKEQIEEKQPEILRIAQTWAGDKGYDDTKLIEKCWDQYQIKPVIDIRNIWKDGEETRKAIAEEPM
jgi:ubiquinone biosynthesis protein Coq4